MKAEKFYVTQVFTSPDNSTYHFSVVCKKCGRGHYPDAMKKTVCPNPRCNEEEDITYVPV